MGDGANRWPSPLRRSRVARLAVEAAPVGSVVHAVGDEGVAFRQIAEAAVGALGVPSAAVDRSEAGEHFGFLGHFVGLDSPASASITQELLGWHREGPSLLKDLGQDHYFAHTAARVRDAANSVKAAKFGAECDRGTSRCPGRGVLGRRIRRTADRA